LSFRTDRHKTQVKSGGGSLEGGACSPLNGRQPDKSEFIGLITHQRFSQKNAVSHGDGLCENVPSYVCNRGGVTPPAGTTMRFVLGRAAQRRPNVLFLCLCHLSAWMFFCPGNLDKKWDKRTVPLSQKRTVPLSQKISKPASDVDISFPTHYNTIELAMRRHEIWQPFRFASTTH